MFSLTPEEQAERKARVRAWLTYFVNNYDYNFTTWVNWTSLRTMPVENGQVPTQYDMAEVIEFFMERELVIKGQIPHNT